MAENAPLLALPDTEAAIPMDPMDEEYTKALRDDLLEEFLPNYTPKHVITNHIDGFDTYKINTSQPLEQFNTANAKAYLATDEQQPEAKLYALICEKHLPIRVELANKIMALQKNKSATHALLLVKLHAHGVTHITAFNQERYVFIYSQPKGQTLFSLINSQPQAFSDRFITEKVVVPLNQALMAIESLGYSHGKVNPKKIYMDDSGLTLGECCSEPCGYSQDFHFEPICQIQAHPSGKGSGYGQVDYYALGVIVALMKLRPAALNMQDKEAFIRRMLQEGSYIGITGFVDLSDEISDILRGTLNDNMADRWNSAQVTEWCKGKHYNLLSPSIPSLGGRPFEFNDANYSNLRQLANAIHAAWEDSMDVFEDLSIIRWIEQAVRQRDLSDYLAKTLKPYRMITSNNIGEIITRVIYGLDYAAPVRLKSVSMHVDGANTLLAEIYHEQDQTLLAEFKDAITQSLFTAWQDARRYVFHQEEFPKKLQEHIGNLDRTRLCINRQQYGFGIERTLYDINPNLPCLSDILKQHYATTLSELLIALDNVATTADKATVPLDRHISAFIASKLSIGNPIIFEAYTQSTYINNHRGFLALKFLQKAQSKTQMPLPGLAAWVVASLTDGIATFHSKTIRKQLSRQLQTMAKEGDLTAILNYLTAYDYSLADAQGFYNASQHYTQYTAKIKAYRDEKMLEYRAFKLGNTIAKFVSYVFLICLSFYFFTGE